MVIFLTVKSFAEKKFDWITHWFVQVSISFPFQIQVKPYKSFYFKRNNIFFKGAAKK